MQQGEYRKWSMTEWAQKVEHDSVGGHRKCCMKGSGLGQSEHRNWDIMDVPGWVQKVGDIT